MRFDRFIEVIKVTHTKDNDAFSIDQEEIIASVRANREGRHGSLKWANRASFSEATEQYIFRKVPDIEIKTDMIIVDGNDRFVITSVEDVKGRGMYIEVLCKEVKASG